MNSIILFCNIKSAAIEESVSYMDPLFSMCFMRDYLLGVVSPLQGAISDQPLAKDKGINRKLESDGIRLRPGSVPLNNQFVPDLRLMIRKHSIYPTGICIKQHI